MWVFKWLCTLSLGVTTRMLSSFKWEIWISFVSSLVSEFHSLLSQSHQFWGDLNLFRYYQSQCYYLLNLKGQNKIFSSIKFGPETFMALPCMYTFPIPFKITCFSVKTIYCTFNQKSWKSIYIKSRFLYTWKSCLSILLRPSIVRLIKNLNEP